MLKANIHYILFLILCLCISCSTTLDKKTFYPNGKIKVAYTVSKKDTNLILGTYKAYYENGTLMEEVPYKDGKQHGERKLYFENGKINIIENYKQGIYEGKYLKFNEDGSKDVEGQYVNNAMSGEWAYYFSSPKNSVKERVNFKDNMENGASTEYHTNGKVYAEGNYTNEKEQGWWTVYDSTGKAIQKIFYNEGFPEKREKLK
jgi:antitoxin component YwqK of YwqJK toxin-antitoxin module